MIVLDQELLNHPKFKNDPEWGYFLNNFKQFKFAKIKIKNVGTVLTKNTLMFLREFIKGKK